MYDTPGATPRHHTRFIIAQLYQNTRSVIVHDMALPYIERKWNALIPIVLSFASLSNRIQFCSLVHCA